MAGPPFLSPNLAGDRKVKIGRFGRARFARAHATIAQKLESFTGMECILLLYAALTEVGVPLSSSM
jgi:hypothetical protein